MATARRARVAASQRDLPPREVPVAVAVNALLSGRANGVPADVLVAASPGLRLVLDRLAERSWRPPRHRPR